MPRIEFIGRSRWLLAFSAALVLFSVVALAVRGLTFGIEFQGGTVMHFIGADDTGVEDVRQALDDAGVPEAANATIQRTEEGEFIVRTAESDPDAAAEALDRLSGILGLPEQEPNVTTIGPGWGRNITNAALLALAVSLGAILLYIAVRFEYKMSVIAVGTLVHDIVIVLGVYALAARAVTPNTVAALLSILGYSLYDTVVVFHRIRENSQHLVKTTFSHMANDSLNQVLIRSLNTSVTSIIPVIVLFFFGGETLQDFAFALMIGIALGVYSSIGFATPLYVMWKETEPKYRALAKRAGRTS
ncbi:MAG: protein translocase subunit SecF [Coriobacteriia bacterium]|nr:protein translocase subunit SecF [Coriobacteriia bacterium]